MWFPSRGTLWKTVEQCEFMHALLNIRYDTLCIFDTEWRAATHFLYNEMLFVDILCEMKGGEPMLYYCFSTVNCTNSSNRKARSLEPAHKVNRFPHICLHCPPGAYKSNNMYKSSDTHFLAITGSKLDKCSKRIVNNLIQTPPPKTRGSHKGLVMNTTDCF